MRLVVVGCSGSFAGPDSAASCYLVEARDGAGRTWRVLLDLGSGALGPLQRVVDPADLDAVALSHLHPDHVADVSGLYVYLKYHPGSDDVPGGRPGPDSGRGPMPVHGPDGTADRIAAGYGLEPGGSMSDQLVVHGWQSGLPVQVGPLEIVPVPVRHPVPAFGLRITGPGEQDPGRRVVLAYTGDTDTCDGVDELAAGADALLCEAAFLEHRDGLRGIHLTGRRAGEIAARARAGRLVLTHIPPWNDPADTLAEARSVYDGLIDMAATGVVITL